MALLVCLTFAAIVVGSGAAFRELQADVGMPRGSTITVVAVVGAVAFLAIPIAARSRGTDAAVVTYTVTQGAAAVLWALGYVSLGAVALRTQKRSIIRAAGVATTCVGAVSILAVVCGRFTDVVTPVVWGVLVCLLSGLSVGVASLLRTDHHLHPVVGQTSSGTP
jgi:predicted permease